MGRGKKLSRQIARYLGVESAEQDLVQFAPLADARIKAILENVPAFLEVIDNAYHKYEENLAIAERNLTLSSQELIQVSRSLDAMINSLGQGFLIFDKNGVCAAVYSKACENLLETMPAGKNIIDLLQLDEERRNRFAKLLELAFDNTHAMSFEEIMHFAPRMYINGKGTHIQLDYKPDYTKGGRLDRVVLVATDITKEIQAQDLADERKMMFESIERVLQDRQSFGSFIRHMLHFSDAMIDLAQNGNWENFRRDVHTLKGDASLFRLRALILLIHKLEGEIDDLVNMSQELRAETLADHRRAIEAEVAEIAKRFKDLLGMDIRKLDNESVFDRQILLNFAHYLDSMGLTDLRQEYIRRVCTQSLASYLRRFDLALQDMATNFDKRVDPIRFTGDDVPIVVNSYRSLLESFVHIFRNIMDHGIERPDIRKLGGKSEAGNVGIHIALIQKDINGKSEPWIAMDIKDDGTGININKLREKLVKREPTGGWANAADEAILNYLLTNNLSSRDTVTEYSGRGIGMNAVYAEVKKYGGTITLSTEYGHGSTTHIEVPYRLEWHD